MVRPVKGRELKRHERLHILHRPSGSPSARGRELELSCLDIILSSFLFTQHGGRELKCAERGAPLRLSAVHPPVRGVS